MYKSIGKVGTKSGLVNEKMILIAKAKKTTIDITKLSIDERVSCDGVNSTTVVKNYFNSDVVKKGKDPFPNAKISFKTSPVKGTNITTSKLKPRGNGYKPAENLGRALLVHSKTGVKGCGIITDTKKSCKKGSPVP
eukprot:CAMPEP_0198263858 /NCGR_PEP_ID=MMETSP1447-20131203/13832_1 /TAXON_ID=420782 /ORGANISM="Chaetoceros dichaeta, Strain CCMP1751" /LENGTH=135 /DNA_ID=CAMNT_0043952605 /DNA_START=243 /DNA_END=650 /DNA_ORIENTATION=-